MLPPSLHYNDTDSALSFVPTTEHRKKGKDYEIASGQALNRPYGAQDKHQLGRGFLEWVEGHRHAASSDTVRLGRLRRPCACSFSITIKRARRAKASPNQAATRPTYLIDRFGSRVYAASNSGSFAMLAAICSRLTHAATNLWPGSLRPGFFLRGRQRPRRLNSTGPVELRGNI